MGYLNPELAETLRRLARHGWAPVRWAHHRPEIKHLIRFGRFRPKAKSCFENCTNVMLTALGTEYESKLCYCEGWVTTATPTLIPTIAHAWLLYDDELVEMTLVGRDITYGKHRVLTAEQVRESVLRTRRFGPHTDIHRFGFIPETRDELRDLKRRLNRWETT